MSTATLTPDAFMAQQQSAAPPPSTLTPDSFMAQQAATTPVTPQATPAPPPEEGMMGHVAGFGKGVYDNLAGSVKGVHDLFQEPQTDEERNVQQKVMIGDHGKLGGRLALAGYRLISGLGNTITQSDKAGQAGAQEMKDSGSVKAGILTDMENEPIIGKPVQWAEHGDYGKSIGDLLTSIATMRAGESVKNPVTDIPATEAIADTKLPVTVGQSLTKTNPAGIAGPSISGLENVTQKLPFTGGPLKEVARGQQTGARQILANKAATTGADVSAAPSDVEQNFTNAVDKAREQGSAKYQQIAEQADKADLSKPVSSASSILADQELAKILPKSTRDALSKVASSQTEQEATARAIYGKPYSKLEPDQMAEVGKAMQSAPEPAGIGAALKARSELASAANSLKDPADRMRLHGAVDDYDNSLNESLAAHDKANGTNLVSDLKDAKQLWTQKYAFDNFKAGLQQVMRGQPSQGVREIPGQAFQRMINKLDPAGGLKGNRTSVLQRMFPDDPQSVKDLHDLADFMGRNQASAGSGMSGAMASMRILGLKASAAAMLGSASGFAAGMARPGFASAVLTALKAGKDAAKLSAAAGMLNHIADQAGGDHKTDDTLRPRQDPALPQAEEMGGAGSKGLGGADSDSTQQQTTKPTTQSTPQPAQNSAIPRATSTTIEPPAGEQGNPTPSTNWVTRAVESAKAKNTQAPDSGSKWVAAAVDRARASSAGPAQSSTPPASLWAGKENKRLTLKNPSNGHTEKWSLPKGTPVRVD